MWARNRIHPVAKAQGNATPISGVLPWLTTPGLTGGRKATERAALARTVISSLLSRRLRLESHYEEGKKHGRTRAWFRNGKLKVDASYRADLGSARPHSMALFAFGKQKRGSCGIDSDPRNPVSAPGGNADNRAKVLVFAPRRPWLAVAFMKGDVVVYDWRHKRQLKIHGVGNTGEPAAIHLSPNGSRLLVLFPMTLVAYNPTGWGLVGRVNLHRSASDFAFVRQGQELALFEDGESFVRFLWGAEADALDGLGELEREHFR